MPVEAAASAARCQSANLSTLTESALSDCFLLFSPPPPPYFLALNMPVATGTVQHPDTKVENADRHVMIDRCP